VGRGMCTRLKARFDIQDPSMLGPYRQQLFASCGGNQFEPNVMVNMDPYTPLRFDNQVRSRLLEYRYQHMITSLHMHVPV